jgi:hypothetical protein
VSAPVSQRLTHQPFERRVLVAPIQAPRLSRLWPCLAIGSLAFSVSSMTWHYFPLLRAAVVFPVHRGKMAP